MLLRRWGNREQSGKWVARIALAGIVIAQVVVSHATGAIVWDAEGASQWWFDPVNWNAASNANTVLPPSNNATGTTATETHINLGSGAWNQGEGVVYDPANDPFFAAAESLNFPSNFGRQKINHLFMSRGTAESTLLTIKGDLTFQDRVHVGSASGNRGQATNATIVQESGAVLIPSAGLDLAQISTSSVGFGNGTYDYRGGTLEVAQSGGTGLRLSVGSTNTASDGQRAGPAGVGKFIVHNPGTPGHVRVFTLTTATFAGIDEGIQGNPNDSVLDPMFDANGDTTGVGIFEFHYAHGGTRPIQVNSDMFLNNGVDNNTKGVLSTRLSLVLDEPACEGPGCVPANVGLFDVAYDGVGSLLGSGDLNANGNFTDDRVFSSIDNSTHFREGDIVSALFGTTQYNWTISYTGNINWANANDSTISSVTGMGTGDDIVLIGHSSGSPSVPGDFNGDGDVDGYDFLIWQRGQSPNPLSAEDLATWQSHYGTTPPASVSAVPEPTSLVLICASLPLWARRCRRRGIS